MNPFNLLYEGMWVMLLEWPGFPDLEVRPGNVVRFDAGRSPLKIASRKVSGLEIMLAPGPLTRVNLHQTSSTAMIARRYDWLIATGDLRADSFLHQLEWGLVCVHADQQDTLTTLEWPAASGWNFVKKVDLSESAVGFESDDNNRGILGWSAVCSSEVEMHFRRADLHSQTGA